MIRRASSRRAGIVEDNLGQFYGEVVFAIAPSEIQRGLIWAGTNDGKLWYTKDGGSNWTNVTKNMTGLPAWGTIRKIEPSHFDPATAYVAIDFHMMDNRKPFIYKTTDFGQTWTNITGDLPATHPLDYVMAVAENPNRKGMLFAGTGHNFFYSLDDGAHWTQFNEGLAAHRGVVDRRAQAMARRRRLDVRPRHLHSARHRAARADGADRRRRRHAVSAASRVPAIAHGPRRHHLRAQDRIAAAGTHRDSRFGEQGRSHAPGADARRAQSHDMGSSLRSAARGCAADARARQPAHLRGAALRKPSDASDHALGNSGRADRAVRSRSPARYTVRLSREWKDGVAAAHDRQGSRTSRRPTPTWPPSTQAQVRVRDDHERRGGSGQQARGHAQADYRPAEGERGQAATSRRRSPSSTRRCWPSSCSSCRART